VDEIGERYRLNHGIVVQAARQAVVYEKMWLLAACLRNTPHVSAIYSTLTNTALDYWA